MLTQKDKRSVLYGRRKLLPLDAACAVYVAILAARTNKTGVRIIDLGVLAFAVWYGWRNWTHPEPKRALKGLGCLARTGSALRRGTRQHLASLAFSWPCSQH